MRWRMYVRIAGKVVWHNVYIPFHIGADFLGPAATAIWYHIRQQLSLDRNTYPQ